MRHLILHIGNHKTGTTAIQHWIGANRAVLAARGIRDLHGEGETNAHGVMAYIDEDHIFPRGYRLDKPQAFAQTLAQIEADKVIVSSENFAFFFEQSAIDELAATVLPLFDTVRVVCYIRRQDRHAVSHHAEGARPDRRPEWELWGHAFSALPAPNAFQPLYLDYDRRLARWEKAFGARAMVVRIYDRKRLIDGDAVADFADAAGIDTAGCVAPPQTNETLDRAKARLGHMINGLTEDVALAETLMRATPNGKLPPRPARAFAQAFLQPYLAGNRALNARLGLSALPELFDDDFSDLPEQPQLTWTDEEFNRILRALVMTFARSTSRAAIASPDDLREAAVALSTSQPVRALRLVELALLQRPTGKTLQEMRARLMAWLGGGRRGKSPDFRGLQDDPDAPDAEV